MLYSKNGSLPMPQTDGTDGWIEVPYPPECPEGKEIVWWYPPGWVVRDPKPADEEGHVWSWSQSEQSWLKYSLQPPAVDPASSLESTQIELLTSGQIEGLTTAQISGLG
jgi:hypothetical protein